MRTRPRSLVAVVAVLVTATVLGVTATAAASAGTIDPQEQALLAGPAQTTTTNEPIAEDQDPDSLIIRDICDLSCDPCGGSPFCDPCVIEPWRPECGPLPGPPPPPPPPPLPSFYCTPNVFSVDDPPAAERPTKVAGVGTLRCTRAANMDMYVSLFFSYDNGNHWTQMSQAHMVFYDVPQNTARQLDVEYVCGGELRGFGWWKAELNYKADNRSGSGYPASEGPAVWSDSQYLYNISC